MRTAPARRREGAASHSDRGCKPEQSIPPPRHGARDRGEPTVLAAPPRLDLAHRITTGLRSLRSLRTCLVPRDQRLVLIARLANLRVDDAKVPVLRVVAPVDHAVRIGDSGVLSPADVRRRRGLSRSVGREWTTATGIRIPRRGPRLYFVAATHIALFSVRTRPSGVTSGAHASVTFRHTRSCTSGSCPFTRLTIGGATSRVH
jgi:hypothetical protein